MDKLGTARVTAVTNNTVKVTAILEYSLWERGLSLAKRRTVRAVFL